MLFRSGEKTQVEPPSGPEVNPLVSALEKGSEKVSQPEEAEMPRTDVNTSAPEEKESTQDKASEFTDLKILQINEIAPELFQPADVENPKEYDEYLIKKYSPYGVIPPLEARDTSDSSDSAEENEFLMRSSRLKSRLFSQ